MESTLAMPPGDEQGCCACTDCGGTDNQQACFWDLNLRAPAALPSPEDTDVDGQDYFSAQETLEDADQPPRRGSVSDRLKLSLLTKLGKKTGAVRPADRSPSTEDKNAGTLTPKPPSKASTSPPNPTTNTQAATGKAQSASHSSRRRRSRRSRRESSVEPTPGEAPAFSSVATPDEVVQLRRRCHQLEQQVAANKAQEGDVERLKASLVKLKEQHRTVLKAEKKNNEQLNEVLTRQGNEVTRLLEEVKSKETLLSAATASSGNQQVKAYQDELARAQAQMEELNRHHLHAVTELQERLRHTTNASIQFEHALRVSEAQRMQMHQQLSVSQQQLYSQDAHLRQVSHRARALERTLSTASIASVASNSPRSPSRQSVRAVSTMGTTPSSPTDIKAQWQSITQSIGRTVDLLPTQRLPSAKPLRKTWDGTGSPYQFHLARGVIVIRPYLLNTLQTKLESAFDLVVIGNAAWNAYLSSPLLVECLELGVVVPDDHSLEDDFGAAVGNILHVPAVVHALKVLQAVSDVPQLRAGSEEAKMASRTELEAGVRAAEASARNSDEDFINRSLRVQSTKNGICVLLHDQAVLSCTPLNASDVRLLKQASDVVTLPLSSLLSSKLSLSSHPECDPKAKVAPVSLLQRHLKVALAEGNYLTVAECVVLTRQLAISALLNKLGLENGLGSDAHLQGWDSLLAASDPGYLALTVQLRRLFALMEPDHSTLSRSTSTVSLASISSDHRRGRTTSVRSSEDHGQVPTIANTETTSVV
eukprot:m.220049 g.220049  ORF g.220049 m.220049 type:complete len:762 (-) comp17240_c1_seq1:1479-3764(-)